MPSGLPATFPARMDGQLAIVAIVPPFVKWHPAPAEFSATRLDGRRFAIADITAMSSAAVGGFKTLTITADGQLVRMFAAGDLIDRVQRYLDAVRHGGGI